MNDLELALVVGGIALTCLIAALVLVYCLCCRGEQLSELQVPLMHEYHLQQRTQEREEPEPNTVSRALDEREAKRRAHDARVAASKSRSERHRQRTAVEPTRHEAAVLDMRFYLRSLFDFQLKDYMPDMGSRAHKQFFAVEHKNGQTYLLTATPSKLDFASHVDTLNRLLGAFRSPYVLPTLRADYRGDRKTLITVRTLSGRGSLRDYVSSVRHPTDAWQSKYADDTSDVIDEERVARIGRQILEGLTYLKAVGCPYGHLSMQNVIIDNGVCRLTDYENAFALCSPHLSRYTSRFADTEERDVVAFAHIIYELAAGFALDDSRPDYFPPEFPRSLRRVVKSILAPKGDIRPLLDDVIDMPVFADVGLPEDDDEETRISKSMRALLMHVRAREQPPPKLRRGEFVEEGNDDVVYGTSSKEGRAAAKAKKATRKAAAAAAAGPATGPPTAGAASPALLAAPTPAPAPSAIAPPPARSSTPVAAGPPPPPTPPAGGPPGPPPPPPPASGAPKPPPAPPGPAAGAPAAPRPAPGADRGSLLSSIASFSKNKLKKVEAAPVE